MGENLKETEGIAYGRVGLLGNPSDMYGGKALSFTFDNKARVIVKDNYQLKISDIPGKHSQNTLAYNDTHDLIKATIKSLELEGENIDIQYESEIHVGSGLSGSTAIIVAAMRALNEHFKLGLDKNMIAEKALYTEVDELGIAAGFQDRYVISHQGLCHMDFSGKEVNKVSDNYAKITKLNKDLARDIPFFLAYSGNPKTSASVHNRLFEDYKKGNSRSREIKEQMDKIAFLADLGFDAIIKRDWKELGNLMNKNTELREKISPHLPKDMIMINESLKYGALGAKVAGSGGAIIVLYDNPLVLEQMRKNHAIMTPIITGYD